MAHDSRSVVIIGGGHNGLVTAFYLAQAGFSPVVLEAREVLGGVAATEEIHPGFRCPTVMHAVDPVLPEIAKDLQLEKHGLQSVSSDPRILALHPDGRALHIHADPDRTAAGLESFSERDAAKYLEFHSCFARLGAALQPMLSTAPPDMDHLKLSDYANLAGFGLKFRNLARKDAYRLLRWGPMPVADLVAEWFENELLRATVAAPGIFGAFAGPWSAGTSIGLLMQAASSGAGALAYEPGALTQAFAKAATGAGAQIRTNAKAVHIRVKNGEVAGVVLENGEEVNATSVIADVDPRRTFLELVEATELEPGFLRKIQSYRAVGTVAKVNLALSGLPAFSSLKNGSDKLTGRLHVGPDIDYIERAFDAAKYGSFSVEPYMDIRIPSIADPTLAPNGCHVMSVHVQYAPYRLNNADWKTQREPLGDAVLRALAPYVPNLASLVVHRQILTPLDLEQTYGLTGGHIFHGERALDQLFAFRPFLGWAQYRTPIKGLYLCGAGTHPGGAGTGASGANASRVIIHDLKSGH
jgi:phytoene dehydrogenase-like protein